MSWAFPRFTRSHELCHAVAVVVAPALKRWVAGTPVLPAVAALLCVAAYAGQLGLGRWQFDEFMLLSDQRDWGWVGFATRLRFSPRPFSEGVLFLYGAAVLGLAMPLISSFLAVLWTGVLALTALAAGSVLPPSPMRWLTALALAAALFAFVLATNDVAEVFYWPMAAAAYLPTAGAATVLLFLLSGPLSRRRRLACGVTLLVAATSSEMGAVLAVGFAAAAMAVEVGLRLRARHEAGSAKRPWLWAAIRSAAWWLLPGIVGACVLVMVASVRLVTVELGSDAQPYTGRLVPSIGAAAPQLALELLGGGAAGGASATLGALTERLLFGLGFVLVWRSGAKGARVVLGPWQIALAASLLASAFFSLAASLYHFGAPCCERHGTMRAWFIDLLTIQAAGLVVDRQPVRWRGVVGAHRIGLAAPVLLTLALIPAAFRISGLRRDYGLLPMAAAGLDRTWRSGRGPGTGQMNFYLPPDADGALVRGTAQPLGTFRVGEQGTPAMVGEIGRFFGKSVVTVCQSWQTERSWLIHGRFIPACPPHEGPPDAIIP